MGGGVMMERHPAEVFDPRQLFREELDARGIADDEFVKTLHTWLHGGEFTDAVSDCLSLMLGTSTSLWIALHAAWRERGGVMTDAELVARAIRDYYGIPGDESAPEADDIARAVVAALRQAGRLVPEGWTWPKDEKVAGFCVDLGDLKPLIPAEPLP